MFKAWPIEPAGRFWGFALRWLGFAGITLPHGKIYLLPEHMHNPMLRAHEQMHAIQCQRDGYLRFWFLICWYVIRYGYWNSPYEVEARNVSRQAWEAEFAS